MTLLSYVPRLSLIQKQKYHLTHFAPPYPKLFLCQVFSQMLLTAHPSVIRPNAGGTSILYFASEILVGAPIFASKNINDKTPKFCPLNFRYDSKIGTFSQLFRLVVTELPKFFLLFGELGRTLSQILPPNLM